VNAGGAADTAAEVEISGPRPLLSESLELLSRELRSAFTDEAASERQRYIRALKAVGVFLLLDANDALASLRFARLQWALEGLDEGRTDPLLKQKTGRGRQPDPQPIWTGRVAVAIGFEALLRVGDSKEEILKCINRHHRGLHHLMTLQSDKTNLTSDKTRAGITFESSVQGWHYKFIKGKKTTGPSSRIFAYFKQRFLGELLRNYDSDPDAKRKYLRELANIFFQGATQIALDFKQQKELEESKKYA
jgi:hypothetical protein